MKNKKSVFDFVKPFRYLFDNPDAGMNLLFACITMLIPIVGSFVLLGWQGRILRTLVQNKEPSIPRFDFNLFVEYLKEGLLPFVVNVVVLLPIMFVFFFLGVIAAFGFPLMAGPTGHPTPFLIVGLVLGGAMIGMAILMLSAIVMNAAMTRAFLTGDWGLAFEFGAILNYAKRTWRSVLIVTVVLISAGFLIMMVGMMALYLGMYPASVILNLAGIHLMAQIYRQYLSSDGTPIPVKDLV